MRKQKPQRAPRYGAYHVTRRWATPLPKPEAPALESRQPPATWLTLWAEKPLQLPQGRALAIRSRADQVEVAFVSNLTLTLRWEPAERVLTPKQAKVWAAAGGFNRT